MNIRTEHPLFKYSEEVASAVSCLLTNGHMQAALVLIFSAIDQVAWLADEKNDGETIGGAGFEAWVQKYLLERNHELLLGATSADIWGARCGILHTGAPESNFNRANKAKKIHYYNKLLPNSHGAVVDSEGVLFLSFEQLGSSFAAGVVWFLEDLLTDLERDTRVRAKLGRMLVFKRY